MTDHEYDDDLDDDDIDPTPADETPKGLRKAAKEGKAAKAERDALRRELALVKAGVDTESKIGRLFATAYDGDLDVAKIKSEWAEISGSVTPAADPIDVPAADDPDLTPEEIASTAQRQALANGATPSSVPADIDPRVAASNRAQDVVAAGGTNDDALAVMADSLMAAAASGDKRVIVPKRYDG